MGIEFGNNKYLYDDRSLALNCSKYFFISLNTSVLIYLKWNINELSWLFENGGCHEEMLFNDVPFFYDQYLIFKDRSLMRNKKIQVILLQLTCDSMRNILNYIYIHSRRGKWGIRFNRYQDVEAYASEHSPEGHSHSPIITTSWIFRYLLRTPNIPVQKCWLNMEEGFRSEFRDSSTDWCW